MEDKVLVLKKDGQWFELDNCFLVGAVEHPDKVIYYKFLFSKCDKETLSEMLKRAEQFISEQKASKQ
ncbi:hypothetical protein ACFLXC_04945 [Chloroflexota bacterium]